MGYESKLYIVDRHELKEKDSEKIIDIWAQVIANIDMCKMGYDSGFHELFSAPVDYKIFIDGNTETDTDAYGDKLTYASVETVIEWLEKQIASGDTYRRLPILLGLLKGINTEHWRNIQIVHYGH